MTHARRDNTESTRRARADEDRLRRLASGAFQFAGITSGLAFVGQLATVVLAAWPAVQVKLGLLGPVVVAGLALWTSGLRSSAERHKRYADLILRQLDLVDGLGQPLDRLDLIDHEESASWMTSLLARGKTTSGRYFASQLPPGPARLVANTLESAWWSKSLAANMGTVSAVLAGLALIVAMLTLMTVIEAVSAASPPPTSVDTLRAVSTLATSVLLLVFTEGFFRRAGEFREFARVSGHVVERARALRSAPGTISLVDALTLASTYHLARHVGPRIPTLLWRVRRGTMTQRWAEVVRDTEQVPPDL